MIIKTQQKKLLWAGYGIFSNIIQKSYTVNVIHPIRFHIEVATCKRPNRVLNYLLHKRDLNKDRQDRGSDFGSFKFGNFIKILKNHTCKTEIIITSVCS